MSYPGLRAGRNRAKYAGCEHSKIRGITVRLLTATEITEFRAHIEKCMDRRSKAESRTMKHPIFHPGETCWARVPTSQGTQWTECDITGPLVRRMIRDLDLKPLGYALAYMVLMDGATMETPWREEDLCKKWQRSDWRSLKQIWQPRREAR